MPRDISKMRESKRTEIVSRKKKNQDSDSDDHDAQSSDMDDEMDVHEFRKYIQKIFPSKYLNNKIKAGEKDHSDKKEKEKEKEKEKNIKSKSYKKPKKVYDSEDQDEDDYSSEEKSPKKTSVKKSSVRHNRKRLEQEEEEELNSDDDSEDDDYDSEDEDYEDENETPKKGTRTNMNILLTINDANADDDWEDYDDDEWEDYDDETEEEEEDEDEDVSVSSVSSEEEEEEEEEERGFLKEKEKEKEKKKKDPLPCKESETLLQLKELLAKNPNDKSIQKCVDTYEKEMAASQRRSEKKTKKQKAKNMRIFRKMMSDKHLMNDFSFYEKLECENQKRIIKEMREINKHMRIEKPYRMSLLEASIPIEVKSAAFKKINSLNYLEPGSGEFYKIKNWVDTFMKIPFNVYQSLPINIDDGVDKCHEFMENAQQILNNAVFGLDDAKMQIMQLLGQLLINPTAIGTAIAIHGPPGTGKTSLVKEGISKILNRPFAFIALGGATDSSFLEGHGYTYEGSTWGKIVQILIESKCMNPVIYFDELDKISDTPRGEEIIGILTHLTDTSQNSQFHDKYFAEINFDLSKCLFIFSYNDESKVNPILKDRMYRIKTNGYSGKEKQSISHNYLLPKIREQIKFKEDEIVFSDEVINYINENYCQKENGVRNLKRCLEIIHTKLNLYRLMKSGTNLFEKNMSLTVKFPLKVTREIVDKLIKKESDGLETWRSLYN